VKFLLIVILGGTIWSALCTGNSTVLGPSQNYVVIDARAVSDDYLAKILTAAVQASGPSDWFDVSVVGNKSLDDILADQYNLTQDNLVLYPKTHDAVRRMIFKGNSINAPDQPLPVVLRLPRLPCIPDRDARADLVQVQRARSNFTVVQLGQLGVLLDSSMNKGIDRRKASTIAFLDTDAFKDALSKQGRARGSRPLYAGPQNSFLLNASSSSAACDQNSSQATTVQVAVPESVRQRIGQIPPALAGDLYILDFDFDATDCSHGKKVRDVAVETLRRYGASHLVNDHVKTIELNYFGHPSEVRETLRSIITGVVDSSLSCQYRRLFAESFNTSLNSCADELPVISDAADSTGPARIPGFYLWLIFEYVLDSSSQASVVSSSFFTTGDGFDVATSEMPGRWPALVAAVLNPDWFPPSHVDELPGSWQPARRFWERRADFGTFLIGALLNDRSTFGMTSSETLEHSDAVTAFAYGQGYGGGPSDSADQVKCISPNDTGTSFATPAVAVQLYLARALWRTERQKTNNALATDISAYDVPVMEAKRRLELSSAVEPGLIGKASAAGMPEFERLIAPTQGTTDVLVTSDGYVKTGVVEFAQVSLGGSKRQYGGEDIGGIQVIEGQVFVYDEHRMAWRKADTAEFFVRIQGQEIFTTPVDFSKSYHTIARYR
jgi:hypothetical protein